MQGSRAAKVHFSSYCRACFLRTPRSVAVPLPQRGRFWPDRLAGALVQSNGSWVIEGTRWRWRRGSLWGPSEGNFPSGRRVMSDSESEEECGNRQLKFVLLGDGASGKVSTEGEKAEGPQGRIEGFPNKAGLRARGGGKSGAGSPRILPGAPRPFLTAPRPRGDCREDTRLLVDGCILAQGLSCMERGKAHLIKHLGWTIKLICFSGSVSSIC